jgi:hypothetical protein
MASIDLAPLYGVFPTASIVFSTKHGFMPLLKKHKKKGCWSIGDIPSTARIFFFASR